MNDPWFDPALYSWIPGTVFGTSLGMFGGLSGYLSSSGKARTLCLSLWGLFGAIAVVFLGLALTAYFTGQPYGIWYGFGLPALLGIVLIPSLVPSVLQQYRKAEERKIHAADLNG